MNKWNNIDMNTLVTLCVNMFNEKEIEASKDTILNLQHDKDTGTKFIKQRSGKTQDSKSINNLYDICQLLEEKGNPKLSDFVALYLSKLLFIFFNNIDVTVLLRKIENMACTVDLVKSGLNTVSDTTTNLTVD